MSRPRGRWIIREQEFRVVAARRGFRTQSQVAAVARMNPTALSAILGGRRVGDEVAGRIATALSSKPSKIFREVDTRPAPLVQLGLELDESAEADGPADESEAPSASAKSERCA